MKTLLLALVVLGTVPVTPATAGNGKVACAGFFAGSSPVDVDRFYAERAVSIVSAGRHGHEKTLGASVAPAAKFTIWRGDLGVGRQVGVAGAIEMARNIAATRFQSVTRRPGPISIAMVKCEWSTVVLFRNQQTDTGINVTFKFIDGLLAQADGYEVALLEGDVR